jgi:hypothetical protein
MEDKIEKILHADNHKEKKWAPMIQHTRTLGHNQKIKPKNLWHGRGNGNTN